MENKIQKKPRILCLHGFRKSGAILKKMVTSRWPESVLEKLELDFLDGPYPAQGKSSAEGIFKPPYYEWFQTNKDFQEFYNFEECLNYIEGYMIQNGPFDGVFGFSQGAILAASMPGMQRDGVALTKVPKLKFLIIGGGARFGHHKFGTPKLAANSFSTPLQCLSLHLLEDTNFRKGEGEALVQQFVDPIVIRHFEGHTIPSLDEDGEKKMIHFLEEFEEIN